MFMSARPAERGDGHDLIHLGGETAVVVPLHEYRMLETLRERASAEEIEEAEIEAAINAQNFERANCSTQLSFSRSLLS